MNLVDLATAIRFRVVRARDKGPADLDRVPARLHAEPERFLCLDVLWGESLHQVLSVGVRSHIESRWNLQASAARACRVQLTRWNGQYAQRPLLRRRDESAPPVRGNEALHVARE